MRDEGLGLPELAERDAKGAAAEIYADIRETLGVPMVNLIYRYMATIPRALPWVWGTLRPDLVTGQIDRVVGAILEHAAVATSAWPALRLQATSNDDATAVRNILRNYAKANATNLIALRLLVRRVEADWSVLGVGGRVEVLKSRAVPARQQAIAPALIAEFLRLAEAQGLDEIGMIPTLYIDVAPWPKIIWPTISYVDKLISTGELVEATTNLLAFTDRWTADIEQRCRIESAKSPSIDDLAVLLRVLRVFTERAIPQMCLIAVRLERAIGVF